MKERNNAQWVSSDGVFFRCDNCQTKKDEYFVNLNWKYCPNCGAYMKSKEDEKRKK